MASATTTPPGSLPGRALCDARDAPEGTRAPAARVRWDAAAQAAEARRARAHVA